jgi:hypothetical protein
MSSSPISIRHLCCAAALLAAAACGASPSNGSGQASDAQALRWAQCMQQHGVNAGVSQNGQGRSVHVPVPGQGPNSESQQQLQAAQAACKQYEPNGGAPRQPLTSQQLDKVAKYVACLNQHGADAQMAQDGGIDEKPGPGGPSTEAQADEACKSLQPGH